MTCVSTSDIIQLVPSLLTLLVLVDVLALVKHQRGTCTASFCLGKSISWTTSRTNQVIHPDDAQTKVGKEERERNIHVGNCFKTSFYKHFPRKKPKLRT